MKIKVTKPDGTILEAEGQTHDLADMWMGVVPPSCSKCGLPASASTFFTLKP